MDGDKALALLDKALASAGEGRTRDDVLAALLTGQASVIYGERSYLIATLHESEDGSREAHAWVGAGDRYDLCGPVKAMAEEWARLNGASAATLGGRRGWSRVLSDYRGDGEIRKAL